MKECIPLMERTFHSLAGGGCLQPLRAMMRLQDGRGLMGMMAGANPDGVGIKIITSFPGNDPARHPSHQGIVILFGARHGEPLMLFDAAEITSIRTAAASAAATRLLSRDNSEVLAIIGTGEQAERHIEAILLVREIKQVNIWGRTEKNAAQWAAGITRRYDIPVHVARHAQEAVQDADIICTVTASKESVVLGDWIPKGAHINAVGSSTPAAP